MYFTFITETLGESVVNVITINNNGEFTSFPENLDSNSPEMLAYLAWLEEGNIPEEWNPEAPQ